MSKKIMLPVDRDKLYAAFKTRGLTAAEVSRSCGFNEGYFSGCGYEKQIPKYAAVALELQFRITPDDYKPDAIPEAAPAPAPQAEAEPPAPPATAPIDYDRLYQTFYAAIYAAVKTVLNEPYQGGNHEP